MAPVTLDGDEIIVARVAGRCYAFGGICTHEEAPLIEGDLDGTTLTCPWHFTEFNIATGEVLDGLTDEALPVYEVIVDGDEVRITKP